MKRSTFASLTAVAVTASALALVSAPAQAVETIIEAGEATCFIPPDAAQQSTYRGRTISSLFPHDGKIFYGYGDYDYNTGSATGKGTNVSYIDPETGEFGVAFEGFKTEEVNTFRSFDGNLYVPNIDPSSGAGLYNGFVTDEPETGSTERVFRDVKGNMNSVHVYDVAKLGGLTFVAGANQGVPAGLKENWRAIVWVSEDGVNFTESLTETNPDPELRDGFERFYWLSVMDGKLYARARTNNKPALKVYDPKIGAWEVAPGNPLTFGASAATGHDVISWGGRLWEANVTVLKWYDGKNEGSWNINGKIWDNISVGTDGKLYGVDYSRRVWEITRTAVPLPSIELSSLERDVSDAEKSVARWSNRIAGTENALAAMSKNAEKLATDQADREITLRGAEGELATYNAFHEKTKDETARAKLALSSAKEARAAAQSAWDEAVRAGSATAATVNSARNAVTAAENALVRANERAANANEKAMAAKARLESATELATQAATAAIDANAKLKGVQAEVTKRTSSQAKARQVLKGALKKNATAKKKINKVKKAKRAKARKAYGKTNAAVAAARKALSAADERLTEAKVTRTLVEGFTNSLNTNATLAKANQAEWAAEVKFLTEASTARAREVTGATNAFTLAGSKLSAAIESDAAATDVTGKAHVKLTKARQTVDDEADSVTTASAVYAESLIEVNRLEGLAQGAQRQVTAGAHEISGLGVARAQLELKLSGQEESLAAAEAALADAKVALELKQKEKNDQVQEWTYDVSENGVRLPTRASAVLVTDDKIWYSGIYGTATICSVAKPAMN